MADTDLRAEPTKGHRLYAQWRTARANWELARFDPAHLGRDLPEDMEALHCDTEHAALVAYLLHPAESLQELARKLGTFRDEDGYAFDLAGEIVAALAMDARNLSNADVDRRRPQSLQAA